MALGTVHSPGKLASVEHIDLLDVIGYWHEQDECNHSGSASEQQDGYNGNDESEKDLSQARPAKLGRLEVAALSFNVGHAKRKCARSRSSEAVHRGSNIAFAARNR